MPPSRWLAGLALSLAAVAASAAGDAGAALSPEHRQWLEEVEPLLSREERRAFLALEKGYQRQAFIAAFWAARDPRPDTPANEFQERYRERREEAWERFGEGWADERAVVFVLNGPPAAVKATDCGVLTWPLELWRYGYSEKMGRGFEVLFYQRNAGGPFRIWHPAEGYQALLPTLRDREDEASFRAILMERCGELWDNTAALLESVRRMEQEGGVTAAEAAAPPDLEDPEWLLAFHAVSTDRPAGAPALAATLSVRFPDRYRLRTVVEGLLEVPSTAAQPLTVGGRPSYAFELTGEVLREGELFESFRYRYELPRSAERLALLFVRNLRPGTYSLVVKLEDLGGGGIYRDERTIEVPTLGETEAAPLPALAAAELPDSPPAGAAPAAIRLRAAGELARGLVRFEAAAEGEGIRQVTFLLDGRPVLTKAQPPYSVELDLGRLPRRHSVRAVAYGADGTELATDEIAVNPGQYAFRVRLVEPRPGSGVSGRVRARAEVEAPEGQGVERVEFYRDEELVATLFQEPWVQPIELGSPPAATFLRIVAYLRDGNATEDLVLLDPGDYGATLEVRLVELYATVLDGASHPVHDLACGDFQVFESGQRQELLRCERLEDLSLHAGLLIDTSASMTDFLPQVREIAQRFFEQAIAPRDRAAVFTFSDRPRLVTGFTSDLAALSAGLAGVHPEQGTALWDSLVYALYTIRDLKGQRALIVLSDGEDRRSDYAFDEALRYATASGVTVYVVGLEKSARGTARRQLERLAEATGGRSFFLRDIAELGAVYEAIQQDLRSRYLLVYQPPPVADEDFRPIEVRVARGRHTVRTLQGYFP